MRMFIEIERKYVPFNVGEAGFFLRFDNRALLNIEKEGFDVLAFDKETLTAKAAKSFLKHGLSCWGKGEHDLAAVADKIIKACDAAQIQGVIAAAMLTALPEPIIGAKPSKTEKTDFSRLFFYFCDIMGKPESLFWELTIREVLQRWDAYAIFHGYKEAPVEVRRYDD